MRHITRSNDTCQCGRIYETSLFSYRGNLDRLRSCLSIHNQRSQYQSGQNTLQSYSQGHTSILRFMMEALIKLTQLACEPAATFPKALPFHPKGPKSPCSCLVIFVSRQGFTDSTNYDVITVQVSIRVSRLQAQLALIQTFVFLRL